MTGLCSHEVLNSTVCKPSTPRRRGRFFELPYLQDIVSCNGILEHKAKNFYCPLSSCGKVPSFMACVAGARALWPTGGGVSCCQIGGG